MVFPMYRTWSRSLKIREREVEIVFILRVALGREEEEEMTFRPPSNCC